VEAILRAVGEYWPRANDIEITLEANPSSVEAGKFAGYASAGVNRVSLGIQALRDPDLRALGRLHDVAEAKRALGIARQTFDRVSFDLIYARQNQTLADWRDELSEALDMAGDHLSLYQLTIEPGTAFGARFSRGGLRGLPDEDLSADMFELTQELTEAAGFEAYEVSNHARNGSFSRHNLVYWRYGDYAGIGPGAHGRLTLNGKRWATVAPSAPSAWLDAVARGNSEERSALSGADQASEYLLMGLRVHEGIDLDRYEALLGRPADQKIIEQLQRDGLLQPDRTALRATDRGRMVLNAVITELMP